MQDQTFMTARWIGKPHGYSSHQVNALLYKHGYLSADRLPTEKAEGLVIRYKLDCGLISYKWDVEFGTALILNDIKAEQGHSKSKG